MIRGNDMGTVRFRICGLEAPIPYGFGLSIKESNSQVLITKQCMIGSQLPVIWFLKTLLLRELRLSLIWMHTYSTGKTYTKYKKVRIL